MLPRALAKRAPRIALLCLSGLTVACGSPTGTSSASYTLALKPGPNGAVSALPTGPTYRAGTVVQLTAAPSTGYQLAAWTGTDNDALVTTTNTVAMTSDRTVSATFAPPATCLPDPVTGNAVARMISPQDGATLPTGAVTFRWCNASADYFLAMETLAGAHDIFFAFAGGPGAGVLSLTLGPACAPTPPTGCVPARGEAVFVTLYTLKQGNILAPSPFHYTYTAAGP